ncbi:hypothetical protein BRADI_1g21835v3 [Brachypodium distachyon]|uniref:Uncharacterized protein n=1 Tax=Brachypodium distachyon TaxID=15368 RepID=A0A2K2DKI1_BRADI|nr:hypothetical protein BRADI_1g21835v3 [Brachypodium distachyon]
MAASLGCILGATALRPTSLVGHGSEMVLVCLPAGRDAGLGFPESMRLCLASGIARPTMMKFSKQLGQGSDPSELDDFAAKMEEVKVLYARIINAAGLPEGEELAQAVTEPETGQR